MKKFVYLMLPLFAVCLLAGCMSMLEAAVIKNCPHSWTDASTCQQPVYCTLCGVDDPETMSSSHKWIAEDCTAVANCKYCGVESYDVINKEHTWWTEEATCTESKACRYCNVVAQEAYGHDWQKATCQAPKTCARCDKTSGSRLSHDYLPATCTTDSVCKYCEKAGYDKAKGHQYVDYVCTVCNEDASFENISELVKYLNKSHQGIPTVLGTIKGSKFEAYEYAATPISEYRFVLRICEGTFWIDEYNLSIRSLISNEKIAFETRVQAFADVIEFERGIVEIVEKYFPGIEFEVCYYASGVNEYWWGTEPWSNSYLNFIKNENGEWYMKEKTDIFLNHSSLNEKMDEIYRAVIAKLDYEVVFAMFSDRFK